jgi:hypothetical protein
MAERGGRRVSADRVWRPGKMRFDAIVGRIPNGLRGVWSLNALSIGSIQVGFVDKDSQLVAAAFQGRPVMEPTSYLNVDPRSVVRA